MRSTGSRESRSSSDNGRGSTSRHSLVVSAIGSIQLVGTLDERAEVGQRGHHHVDGTEVATLVQLAERRSVELVELFLVDRVEAGEAMLRAVVELDVEREGFEQLVLQQRRHEGRRGLDA